jgi:hypothetical protein
MACEAIHNWTLSELVGAFLDLVIAYLLLCASTVAFFASKFLGIFGLRLPCRCNGFFSSPNPNYCTQQLLLDFPVAQVSSVQFSAKNRFPFDSVSARDQNLDSSIKLIGDGSNNVDYEREALVSGDANSQIVVEKKLVVRNQFELKGKKSVTRRRRKSSVDEAKSLSTGDLVIPNQQELPQPVLNTKEEDNVVQEEGETSLNELEGDKEKTIVSLKQKLAEEHAARAALYQELEEERNAAASAANEAMAMILRLQEEKASIEMEARQYQRIIDEKTAYDLEEMNILKEILLRREKEKHFLEKQVEAYRQMNYEHDDPNEDPSRMLQQISESINNNSVEGWVEYGSRSDEFSNVLKYISDCNQELHEKKIITMEREGQNGQSVVFKEEEEVRVHDVHVVDVNRNSPSTSTFETDEMSTSNRGESVSVISDKRTSALDTERVKIENEVGRLRERLRAVQEGRDKLNLSVGYKERENLQIEILEDILVQLQQIRQWNNEPEKAVRQSSLPLPPSKITSQKKRCRSSSLGVDKN